MAVSSLVSARSGSNRGSWTVVERHAVPGLEPGYSVEFFDMLGNTVAVVTVAASALRRPTAADRPMVRQASVASPV